ncbi:MAG: lactate racemase domain-containing protein [bacterium]
MEKQLVFGDKWITARLPGDRTHLPSAAGLDLPLPPVEDLAGAVRSALAHPLDRPPLREMARPGRRVTIAFDDPTVPCYAPVWESAIPILLEELGQAGVDRGRVTLLCANAVHRKFAPEELARILGEPLVREFGDRLLCHDAEDPDNLVHLGRTAAGHDVELNRLVVDSDLTIYVNTSCTRGFSGGWKSVCVGLSTWRSIRWHHTPDLMSMSLERNPLHEILDQMGALVEEKIGPERIFKLETILANPLQVARMWSGSVGAARRAALEVLRVHHVARRDLLPQKADIVLYGVPDWSPYASFSVMNPLLTLVSTGLGYLGGVIEALGKPGCTVVLATPCPDRWDEVHHPSYREVWDRVLAESRDPYRIMELFEPEFSGRADYLAKYRTGFGFHPVHGLMATHPLKRLRHASGVIVAGIREPRLARHLGFGAASTVEEAIAAAEEVHGKTATIACVQYPMALSRM